MTGSASDTVNDGEASGCVCTGYGAGRIGLIGTGAQRQQNGGKRHSHAGKARVTNVQIVDVFMATPLSVTEYPAAATVPGTLTTDLRCDG